MVWPAFYGVVLVALAVVLRTWRPRPCAVLLAGVLALQVVDLSPLWGILREHFAAGGAARGGAVLKDRFWEEAGIRYRRVLFVPGAFAPDDWFEFARFAARHHMTINTGYFARVSWARVEAADRELLVDLRRGRVDPQSLYVVPDLKLLGELERSLPAGAVVRQVDGFSVIVPPPVRKP
jgi:hypothetical protein